MVALSLAWVRMLRLLCAILSAGLPVASSRMRVKIRLTIEHSVMATAKVMRLWASILNGFLCDRPRGFLCVLLSCAL